MLPVPPERLGQPVVPCRREARRDLSLASVDPDLRDSDLAPGSVVSDHERYGNAEASQGLELEPVQAERAVAGDDDDVLRRLRRFHAECVGGTDAEAAERPGIEPIAGPVNA